MAKELVKALKGKKANHKVTELWFGGGGNNGRDCQEMTRSWIQRGVSYKKGKGFGNWGRRKGWVQVHF